MHWARQHLGDGWNTTLIAIGYELTHPRVLSAAQNLHGASEEEKG